MNPKNPVQLQSPTSIKIIDTAAVTSPQTDRLLLSQDSSRISLNNPTQIRVKSGSSDDPLSLEKVPSNQSNKQPKGILKNSPSLAQLDKSTDTIHHRSQLGPASVNSFFDDLEYLVSHNSPILKASSRKASHKLTHQEGNTLNRLKSYDIDDNSSPGTFIEENSNGWNKVRRHFVFGESSVDGRLRDPNPKDKSRILDGNVSFNLWKNGRKLFKPTK